MKLKSDKDQKGITLIALVITIIVLLILAGVAINLALDTNGLFSRANEATTKWNNRVDYEQETIQNVLDMANEYIGGGGGNTLPAGWDGNKVADMVTETSEVAGVTKERTAPIPKGFTASEIEGENTIEGGLVIYQDGEDDEGKKPVSKENNNHAAALETRNQYVWIPVDDINSMIMCSQNSGESVCSITKAGTGSLVCAIHNNSTELVGRLYDFEVELFEDYQSRYKYSCSVNFSKRDQTFLESPFLEPRCSDNEELDFVKLEQLQRDFYVMANSVYTYGGFYFSRYEAGKNGDSLKNQAILTSFDCTDPAPGFQNRVRVDRTLYNFERVFGWVAIPHDVGLPVRSSSEIPWRRFT